MYIVLKFHDYYDGAVGVNGVDKTIVYTRHSIETSLKIKTELDRIPSNSKPINRIVDGLYYKPFLVGFCGKTYVGYKFERVTGKHSAVHYLYGDNAKKFLVKQANNSKATNRWWSNASRTKKEIVAFFDEFNNSEKMFQTFIDFKVPIFKIDLLATTYRFDSVVKNTCTLNPSLKEIKFFKVFDSFQAFQELEMFIGGVLTDADRDVITIDEKYRQQQRGMDKWSFRNPDPPKRKQK